MPPYRQRVVAPPALAAARFARGAAPPAVLSGRRFGSVGCGARRLRGPQRLRALPSPPRHFKWGRGCGAARDGGNEGFRRLRAAGERHPSWVSRAHPSLPLRKIYHFIDSLRGRSHIGFCLSICAQFISRFFRYPAIMAATCARLACAAGSMRSLLTPRTKFYE